MPIVCSFCVAAECHAASTGFVIRPGCFVIRAGNFVIGPAGFVIHWWMTEPGVRMMKPNP